MDKLKPLSGGVGTIKRKRELRQLLEEQDEGYEDDIFDATPFKKTKQFRVSHLGLRSGLDYHPLTRESEPTLLVRVFPWKERGLAPKAYVKPPNLLSAVFAITVFVF